MARSDESEYQRAQRYLNEVDAVIDELRMLAKTPPSDPKLITDRLDFVREHAIRAMDFQLSIIHETADVFWWHREMPTPMPKQLPEGYGKDE
jgi:hypothetical protein